MMPDFHNISDIKGGTPLNLNYQEDYGPLIIDSVVQPVTGNQTGRAPIISEPQTVTKNEAKSTPSKSKFGFGLRKSVFSRKKEEKTESGTGNGNDSSGTLQKSSKKEEDEPRSPKRGFGRLSFSRRKPKNQKIPNYELNSTEDKNKSSSEDIGKTII